MNAATRLTSALLIAAVAAAAFVVTAQAHRETAAKSDTEVVVLPTVEVVHKREVVQLPTVTVIAKRSAAPTLVAQKAAKVDAL